MFYELVARFEKEEHQVQRAFFRGYEKMGSSAVPQPDVGLQDQHLLVGRADVGAQGGPAIW